MTRMEISCTVQLFLAVNFTNLIKFYIILKIILFFLKKKRMKLQKKEKWNLIIQTVNALLYIMIFIHEMNYINTNIDW